MCFTMIYAFNLIPLATGTTGQNGHKTHRSYQLVRLVAWTPPFQALKCKKFPCFWGVAWSSRQLLWLVVLVVIGYFWGVLHHCGGVFWPWLLLWGWWVCLTLVLVRPLECFSCLLFPCYLLVRELVQLVGLVVLEWDINVCTMYLFWCFMWEFLWLVQLILSVILCCNANTYDLWLFGALCENCYG